MLNITYQCGRAWSSIFGRAFNLNEAVVPQVQKSGLRTWDQWRLMQSTAQLMVLMKPTCMSSYVGFRFAAALYEKAQAQAVDSSKTASFGFQLKTDSFRIGGRLEELCMPRGLLVPRAGACTYQSPKGYRRDPGSASCILLCRALALHFSLIYERTQAPEVVCKLSLVPMCARATPCTCQPVTQGTSKRLLLCQGLWYGMRET